MAANYAPLVIAYRNGAAVRLSDVADVQNSVQDLRNLGMSNGQPSVLVILFRQPNANIIETIDNVEDRVAASGSGDAGRHERDRAPPSTAAQRSVPRCTTPN